MEEQKHIGFTIDAGLIQRLGYELVGRAETAVSELIKNSYDADATVVDVDFIDSSEKGGILVISDNGIGMTEKQLTDGFMRISSSDKVHNPVSIRYNRTKAGKKGIGRFATQRLGEQLTIITQTKESDKAIKLVIDWSQYEIDRDLASIMFPMDFVDKDKEEGTTLIISGLREKWTNAAINRVFRYVLDLFQPDYLSERSKSKNIAIQNDSSFKVNFYLTTDGNRTPFLNEQISIFDKSLAVFEGHIDNNHIGSVSVKSVSLDLNDTLSINYTEKETSYTELSDVYFKIHYFIYNRPQYYRDRISRMELNKIQELAKTASGVRLYRNGFRVLPYGEPTDDWTNVDRRWSSESGVVNVPLGNKNLFGFVEIIDPNGDIFEETASREGLIENEAFKQLSDFVNKALIAVRGRIAEKITTFKELPNEDDFTQESDKKADTTKDMLDKLHTILDKSKSVVVEGEDDQEQEDECSEGHIIIEKLASLIEEAGMLRVLAGLGLTIGEFIHEIKQFKPSVTGHFYQLSQYDLLKDVKVHIDALKVDFDELFGYTKYFGTTISQNTNREKEPIDLLEVTDLFKRTISKDLARNDIDFVVKEYDFDVVTTPMHRSEWNSILYNFYTNSKKAIIRANVHGKILVEIGNEGYDVFINFHDNGDGIPKENRDRIFNAFFSTSTPASFNAPNNEQLLGTGLGLKIVKDIVISYNGSITLTSPHAGYATCFQIKVKRNN